jgi:hypothetical protein
MPCIVYEHKALKLEFDNKNNSRKYVNNGRVNNTFLNN